MNDSLTITPQYFNALQGSAEHSKIVVDGQVKDRISFNQIYIRAQQGLLEVHKVIDMPPDVKMLNKHVQKDSPRPHDGGVVSDIYKGTFLGRKKVRSIHSSQYALPIDHVSGRD